MKDRSMRSVLPFMLVLLGIAAVVPSSLSVRASPLVWASDVVASDQGLMKNKLEVQYGNGGLDNCNPPNALGPADSSDFGNYKTFFSLGYGGYIVLAFPDSVCGSLTIYEATWGTYPPENASVYVSQDGTTWTYLGTADNSQGMGSNGPHTKTFTLTSWIRYVKIVDVTNPDPHNDVSDGFDVDAVSAGTFFVIPEMPLGTITALITSLAALALFKRKTLIRK